MRTRNILVITILIFMLGSSGVWGARLMQGQISGQTEAEGGPGVHAPAAPVPVPQKPAPEIGTEREDAGEAVSPAPPVQKRTGRIRPGADSRLAASPSAPAKTGPQGDLGI